MFLMRQVDGLPESMCTILEFLYHEYACYVMVLQVKCIQNMMAERCNG